MFGYSHVADLFVGVIQPLLPDLIVRFLVRLGLWFTVSRLRKCDYPQKELRVVERVHNGDYDDAVAVKTQDANEQHYEVPTPFFLSHLGPNLKYSSCEWPNKDKMSLEQAELFTLGEYARHLDLESCAPGSKVLEVGSGWGSLSLFNAAKYPKLQFFCFSNSQTQIAHIVATAEKRGITNLCPFCLDINTFVDEPDAAGLDLNSLRAKIQAQASTAKFSSASMIPEGKGRVQFDRIVSIECLEHSRNYAKIFKRLSQCLVTEGKMFVQILGHREYTYFMGESWMGRNFFTGGTIPSTKLFLHFNRDLVVDWSKVVNGREYSRTLDAWLYQMYAAKDEVLKIFRDSYKEEGLDNKNNNKTMSAEYMYEKWRMFYIMSSEAFGLNGGQEWMVAYYLFTKR